MRVAARLLAAVPLVVVACGSSGGSSSVTVVHRSLAGGSVFSGWSDGAHRVFLAGGAPSAPGFAGTRELLEYDGASWRFLRTTPTGSSTIAQGSLFSVFGLSPLEIIAAGERSTVLHLRSGRVDAMSLGDDGATTVASLWGSGGGDLWAVGGGLRAGDTSEAPRIFYYDGTRWTAFAVPSGLAGRLLSVWGLSADDVWSVGQAGLILHFDGASWKQVDGRVSETLTGLAGTSPDRVYAVGGDTRAVILHWDGSSFREIQHPLRAPLLSIAVFGGEFIIGGRSGLAAIGTPEAPMLLTGLEATASMHALVPLSFGGALLAGGNFFDPGRTELHGTVAALDTEIPNTFASRSQVSGTRDFGTAPPPPSVTGGGSMAW